MGLFIQAVSYLTGATAFALFYLAMFVVAQGTWGLLSCGFGEHSVVTHTVPGARTEVWLSAGRGGRQIIPECKMVTRSTAGAQLCLRLRDRPSGEVTQEWVPRRFQGGSVQGQGGVAEPVNGLRRSHWLLWYPWAQVLLFPDTLHVMRFTCHSGDGRRH